MINDKFEPGYLDLKVIKVVNNFGNLEYEGIRVRKIGKKARMLKSSNLDLTTTWYRKNQTPCCFMRNMVNH